MSDTAVWLLTLSGALIGGTVAIGFLVGLGWRVAAWVGGF